MSTLNVDKVDPNTGTTLELGTSGDTITIPSGVTIANSGTATGFGAVLTGSTDNQVTTVTAANAIQGETNLTYDGTILGCGATGAAADLGVGVHIRTADSGASVDSAADELVIEGSAHNGMTFLTGTTQTSTINFGDSGDNNIGIVEYNHNTNNMHMYTNAALAMTIDSTGAVTKPLQPAFLAIGSGTAQVPSVHSFTVMDFNTEVYDQGADFASNTTFTAPVTGKYLLVATLNLTTVAGDYFEVDINTSNRRYVASEDVEVNGNGYKAGRNSVIADMDQGDTVNIQLYVGGTCAVQAASNTNFSGCLLC